MDDVENLVDDILARCVPGYVKPERKKPAPRRPLVVKVVKDGFSPAPAGVEARRAP